MHNLGLSKKPFIIITTYNTSTSVHNYARNRGCDFIFQKSNNSYSFQQVVTFILTIKEYIVDYNNKSDGALHKYSASIYSYLDNVFGKIGISPKLLGYKYLQESIYLFTINNNADIYDILKKKFNKTKASIEHAMQNAINKAWSTSDTSLLETFYTAKISIERGYPTVTEFIFYFSNKVKSEIII